MPNASTEVMHIRFDKQFLKRIDVMRKANGLTRAAFVRWLLLRAVNAVTDPTAILETEKKR